MNRVRWDSTKPIVTGLVFEQPLYGGGTAFAGYRNGRGFLSAVVSRNGKTNDGGEFKAGVSVPLLQNRLVDPRRAALWRTTFGRKRVEPEIQAQLVEFIVFGSFRPIGIGSPRAKNIDIAESLVKLATNRKAGLQETREER